MDKDVFKNFLSVKDEVLELTEIVDKLQSEINKISDEINQMEHGKYQVKDKVYGGMGGTQGFTIEGFPSKFYKIRKTELLRKQLKLNERISVLEQRRDELSDMIADVEKQISSVDDSITRRILELRVVQSLPWKDVSSKMGFYMTEGNAKMIYSRFLKTIS